MQAIMKTHGKEAYIQGGIEIFFLFKRARQIVWREREREKVSKEAPQKAPTSYAIQIKQSRKILFTKKKYTQNKTRLTENRTEQRRTQQYNKSLANKIQTTSKKPEILRVPQKERGNVID